MFQFESGPFKNLRKEMESPRKSLIANMIVDEETDGKKDAERCQNDSREYF